MDENPDSLEPTDAVLQEFIERFPSPPEMYADEEWTELLPCADPTFQSPEEEAWYKKLEDSLEEADHDPTPTD